MKILLYIVLTLVVVYVIGLFFTDNIQTEIEIDASPEVVWETLVSLDEYPHWNPFITSATGEVAAGNTIRVTINQKGDEGMSFEPEIIVSEAGKELKWVGKVLVPGLFDGTHSFVIEKISDSRVRLYHSESFRGILVPLIWGSIKDDTHDGFVAMNQALKEKVEKVSETQ